METWEGKGVGREGERNTRRGGGERGEGNTYRRRGGIGRLMYLRDREMGGEGEGGERGRNTQKEGRVSRQGSQGDTFTFEVKQEGRRGRQSTAR